MGFLAGTTDARVASPNAYEEYLPKTLRDVKDVYAEDVLKQRDFADMLLEQALGRGPNPAQNMLDQATANNTQQAAALAASQRGTINPGMLARSIGMQSAQANQEAAGQGALMRAQQQLGAMDALGGQYNTMAGQSLQNLGSVRNYITGMNAAEGQSQQANASIQQANDKAMGQLWQGAVKGAGKMLMGGMAHGGEVPGDAPIPGDSPVNDIVQANLSPGEIVIPRSHASSPEKAKSFIDELMKKKEEGPTGYAKVLDAYRRLDAEMKRAFGSGE